MKFRYLFYIATLVVVVVAVFFLKNKTLPFVVEKQVACVSLVETGDSSKNLNIVFVPDNINDLEKFQSNLKGHIDAILSVEPFKSRSNQINFYFLKVSENFGYADHTVVIVNSGSQFDKISSLIRKCGGADEIVIMLDKSADGSSTPGSHILISSIDDPWKTVHEFGHGFGGLQDTYVGMISFDGNSNVRESNLYTNVDVAGCPKWCGSHTGSYQTACTKITNEQQCRQYERSQVEISGEKKWSCDDPLKCCVWLPKSDPFFGTQCVDFRDNKNIGLSCVENSGCYYGANGQGVWRSVQRTQEGDNSITDSIMNNDQREVWNFSNVETKNMNKIFECLYPKSCDNYDAQVCKDLASKYDAFKKRNGNILCQ